MKQILHRSLFNLSIMVSNFRRAVFLIFLFANFFAYAQQKPPSLQDKLNAQWQLYKKAQNILLQQVQKIDLPIENRVLTRQQWESILTLTDDYAISEQDLIELKNDQELRIKKAKDQAKQSSIIDLNKIRTQKKSKQFCEKVPKGGMLHIHPFGTLDRATAKSLLESLNPELQMAEVFQDIDNSGGNITLYKEERSWLEKIPAKTNYLSLSALDQNRFESFLFLPLGKQPFSRFNAVFSFLGFAIPDWVSYDKVLLAFVQKAVNEGVIYLEFTTGTGSNLFTRLASLEKQTGLLIRANQSFNRTADLEMIDQSLSKFLEAPPSPYLVGIDFLDNEELGPALEKGQLLYGSLLQKYVSGKTALHRTMHAGEIGDIRNPRDAMIMGSERLGHGVNLSKDLVALEYAALIHEPVEINLSSNLRLTNLRSISEHPFLTYLRIGLPVSLSTDDEGIFEIDINHECVLAIDQTDMSYSEWKQMAFNSIQTSFASEVDKKTLFEKLTLKFKEFENDKKLWQ